MESSFLNDTWQKEIKSTPGYECIFHSLYMKKLECLGLCSMCVYSDAKHSGDAEILLVTDYVQGPFF